MSSCFCARRFRASGLRSRGYVGAPLEGPVEHGRTLICIREAFGPTDTKFLIVWRVPCLQLMPDTCGFWLHHLLDVNRAQTSSSYVA